MPSTLEAFLAAAESAIGVPYVWGGSNLQTGVDCSGLIQKAAQAAGMSISRISALQSSEGTQIASMDQAQPGDLLSWDGGPRNDGMGTGADHIAIYIGNGLMIEARKSGTNVQVSKVREGARINRIIGSVPTNGAGAQHVTLGPNASRAYTLAAVSGSTPPPPTGDSSGAPEGGVGDEITPDTPPAEVEAYIRSHFPEVAPFLANEAIKWILYDAAINERPAADIMSAVRQTEYWRTHGVESRAFDALLAQEGADSATVQQRVGDERTRIENLLSRNGVTLDTPALDKVIMESIRGGWTDAELNTWLAGHIRGDKKGLGGEAAVSAADLGITARSFFVPLTQTDLGDWALKIMDGSETRDSFMAYVMDMSRGRFGNSPEVLGAIDRGIAPETYFRPVRNIIAETLELNPDAVDLFSDPRYSAISQFYDAENKVSRPMTLGEARSWARNQDSFKNTREYAETEAGFTSDLLREFGMVA